MSRKPTVGQFLGGLVVVLGLLAVGTGRAQTVVDEVPVLCRSVYLCSPKQPDDVQPFESGWSHGSSFDQQVSATLSALRAKYPDFDIEAVKTGEDSDHDAFNTNYRYKYHGKFVFKPKWEGLFAVIARIIHTSEFSAALLSCAVVGGLLLMLVSRRPTRRLSAS